MADKSRFFAPGAGRAIPMRSVKKRQKSSGGSRVAQNNSVPRRGHTLASSLMRSYTTPWETITRSSRRAPSKPFHGYRRTPHSDAAVHAAMERQGGTGFIQTMLREWAYAIAYRTSAKRSFAFPAWPRHYNQERQDSALNYRSPNSRWRENCQQPE